MSRKTHGVKEAVKISIKSTEKHLGVRVVDFEPNEVRCALCGELCGSFSWTWRNGTRLCREDATHYLGIDTK